LSLIRSRFVQSPTQSRSWFLDMSTHIRILIADDHPVVRAGLEGMLSGQPDFVVVGEAANGAEAVALAAQLHPDVVLMDLRMPDLDGVAATVRIGAQGLAARILILTTYDSDADILRAIEAGATGYLLKDTPREELFRAVRAAAQGQPLLAPAVAARLLERVRAPADETLSAREIEVLKLVAQGASNRTIAQELHISQATVKSHLIHIFGKLGVDDRTAAVTTATRRGILQL
jgi:DNA-binding NarL/FixJ family response regulator